MVKNGRFCLKFRTSGKNLQKKLGWILPHFKGSYVIKKGKLLPFVTIDVPLKNWHKIESQSELILKKKDREKGTKKMRRAGRV